MAVTTKCGVHCISWILVIIGALNWGLVGFFNLNLINLIFGSVSWLERIIYALMGLAAIVMLFDKKCTKCSLR